MEYESDSSSDDADIVEESESDYDGEASPTYHKKKRKQIVSSLSLEASTLGDARKRLFHAPTPTNHNRPKVEHLKRNGLLWHRLFSCIHTFQMGDISPSEEKFMEEHHDFYMQLLIHPKGVCGFHMDCEGTLRTSITKHYNDPSASMIKEHMIRSLFHDKRKYSNDVKTALSIYFPILRFITFLSNKGIITSDMFFWVASLLSKFEEDSMLSSIFIIGLRPFRKALVHSKYNHPDGWNIDEPIKKDTEWNKYMHEIERQCKSEIKPDLSSRPTVKDMEILQREVSLRNHNSNPGFIPGPFYIRK